MGKTEKRHKFTLNGGWKGKRQGHVTFFSASSNFLTYFVFSVQLISCSAQISRRGFFQASATSRSSPRTAGETEATRCSRKVQMSFFTNSIPTSDKLFVGIYLVTSKTAFLLTFNGIGKSEEIMHSQLIPKDGNTRTSMMRTASAFTLKQW